MQQSHGVVERLRNLFAFTKRIKTSGAAHARGAIDHVIIMDGTLSSLKEGCETNAGLTYKLCTEASEDREDANMLVRYEAGIQWTNWRDTRDVIEGRGINKQIQRVYGALASRYRPGDRIFLFGYSRGAYAVRSLSGFIDKVGLLKAEHATEHNIAVAYRHYQSTPDSSFAREFAEIHCHAHTPIAYLGVWDTVAAVGLHFPFLWRFSSVFHEFHDTYPATNVERVYHALARNENRAAYEPVMFKTNPEMPDQEVVQMWFPGTHGDVGGQIDAYEPARKLSNTTLVWMLENAETAGFMLPNGWRRRFLTNPHARSIGPLRGWGKFFVMRDKRDVGLDPSETIHPALHR